MIDFHVLSTRDISTIAYNIKRLKDAGIDLRVIENKGHSVAYGRHKAFFETDSTFVSYIDDDDILRITKEHIEHIVSIDKDALYTNSTMFLKERKILGTPKFVKEWTLRNEVDKLTSPHQTIVYKQEYIKRISLESIELMKSKGWHENVYDYVCRALVSLEGKWFYYPEVTYQWNSNTGGIHKDKIYVELRAYFFGKAKQ